MAFIIDEFRVSIPDGTASFKIEKCLLEATADLNNQKLCVSKDTYQKNLDACQSDYDTALALCVEKTGNKKFRPTATNDCAVEFAKRGFKIRTNAASGRASIDQDALARYASRGDDLAPLVMTARIASTKLSQLKGWGQYAQAGFVQPNWDQFGQPHGRYTCQNPNLTNRITEVRETVVSKEGHSFLSVDLKQAEYAVLAYLSKDEKLLASFKGEEDLHTLMGKEVLSLVPGLEVKDEEVRAFGKTLNFAILYRMRVHTMASQLGCTSEVAEECMAAWAAKAPTANDYIKKYIALAKANERASTYFGRERQVFVPKVGDTHEEEKTLWHHHNAGTAAEVLKLTQARIWNAKIPGARLVIQFFDELIFEVPDEILEETKTLVLEQFSRQTLKGFDFGTDCRTGKNWLEISK